MVDRKTLIQLASTVAVIATVIVMYFQYRDGHYFYNQSISGQSTYTYEIKTFDKSKIPEELLVFLDDTLKNKDKKINNNFNLKVVSGASLKNINIVFNSEKIIDEVILTSGDVVSKVTLSNNKKIAHLSSPEIFEGLDIKGSVVTSGVSNVKMSVSTDNGSYVEVEKKQKKEDKNEEKSLISLVGSLAHTLFSLAFLMAMPFLFYKSITYQKPHNDYENNYTYYLFMGLALSSNWGSILINLFFAHALYFLITRDGLITYILDEYANKLMR